MTDYQSLIDRYLDGELSPEETATLEAWLDADDESLDQFVAQSFLHRELRDRLVGLERTESGGQESGIRDQEPDDRRSLTPRPKSWLDRASRHPKGPAIAIAVAVMIMMVGAMAVTPVKQWIANRGTDVDAKTELKAPEFVAKISNWHNDVWHEDSRPPRRDPRLEAGSRLLLQSGFAEITYYSGATIVLEGPAEYEVTTGVRGRIGLGRLTARVPADAAKGFTIETPVSLVEDLGTEFGVNVRESGFTTVEVFEGKVDLDGLDASGQLVQSREMSASDVLSVDTNGRILSADSIAGQLVRGEQLHALIKKPRFEVVGLYTFENEGQDASGHENHASVVSNVKFGDGYQGKAARFTGEAPSYIDLPIDASVSKMPRMTWGAWVRPSKLGPDWRCILSTDDGGYDRQLTIDARSGIKSTKTHRFAVFNGEGVQQSTGPLPELDEWTFVAAVFDQRSRAVDLYVEDKHAESGKRLVKTSFPALYGESSKDFIRVGMWADAPDETFAGEIDNVFVLKGGLTAQQLESICKRGISRLKAPSE